METGVGGRNTMTCNNYSIAVKEWQQGTRIHSSCTVEVHTLSHTHTLSLFFFLQRGNRAVHISIFRLPVQ